jgi:hypothetical protein
MDRKMIRKGGEGGVRDFEIGGMKSNRHRRDGKRVIRKEGREKKTVKPRRPAIRGRRRIRDVIEGMGNRRGIKETKLLLEKRPRSKKSRRGQMSARRSGVGRVFNEIEITAQEGRCTIKDSGHRIQKKSVEGEVTRFKVNVEDLEGLMRMRFRNVATKLNIAPSDKGKRDVNRIKEFENRRRIDNSSASTPHIIVIPRDSTIRKGRKGLAFIRGEMSFLKTDDVMILNKIKKGKMNTKTTGNRALIGRVVGKAANIVRKNTGSRKGGGGETERQGRGVERHD